jgi:uncharacterized protein (TIGR02145 family)
MKSFILISIFFINVFILKSAGDPIIKFYLKDSSSAQSFNINDIEKMSFNNKNLELDLIVRFTKYNYSKFSIFDIDSMKFDLSVIDQKMFNIYLSKITKYYMLSDIDSFIFRINSTKKIFDTVKICNQVWMKKNLDVTRYRNGDIIPYIADFDEWINLKTGAWCYYNNDPALEAEYGMLYNWYAVNDPRGLAPEGWHIPSNEDWDTLSECLGGQIIAGGKMKESGTSHWREPNSDATNSSGFTALPGGVRNENGFSECINDMGFWWSSSKSYSNLAWYWYLWIENSEFNSDLRSYIHGFSVRCIKN